MGGGGQNNASLYGFVSPVKVAERGGGGGGTPTHFLFRLQNLNACMTCVRAHTLLRPLNENPGSAPGR